MMLRSRLLLCAALLAGGGCDQVFRYASAPGAGARRDAAAADAAAVDDQRAPDAAPADGTIRDAALLADAQRDATPREAALPPDALPPDAPVPDVRAPLPCECGPDQVCTVEGLCTARPQPAPGDIVGEVWLLRQLRPTALATDVAGRMAKASARILYHEPLPADTRTIYPTADGERCAYDSEPHYPAGWPSGPGLSVGRITFAVGGAPGPIELEQGSYKNAAGVITYYYYHALVPPPLKSGASTYSDFFDIGYVPPGAAFTVSTAGGVHIAAGSGGPGVLPAAFTVLHPDIESGQPRITVGQALLVRWSPAQPDAVMEISVSSATPVSVLPRISCSVRDDGETEIPAAAMLRVAAGASVGFHILRRTTRYQRGAVGATTVHSFLHGTHARYGTLLY